MKTTILLAIFAEVALVAAAGLVGADPKSDPVPASESKVSVTLYVRNTAVQEGEASAVVLEVTNGTEKVCRIWRRAFYEREVIVPPGAKVESEVVSRGQFEEPGVWQPRVKIHVPREAHAWFIGIRRPPEGQLEVAPGQTGFLKLDLPRDAFGAGNCKIEAALYDGPDLKTRSQSVDIECLPQKAKGKS